MAASLSTLRSITTGWDVNPLDPFGGGGLFGGNALVTGGAITLADRYLGAIDRTFDRIDFGTSNVAYSLGATPQVGSYGRFGSIGPAGARVYDIARQFGYFGPSTNAYSANRYLGMLQNIAFGGMGPSMLGSGMHDPRMHLGQPILMRPQMQSGGYPPAAPAVPPTPPPQETAQTKSRGRLHEPPVEKVTVPPDKPKEPEKKEEPKKRKWHPKKKVDSDKSGKDAKDPKVAPAPAPTAPPPATQPPSAPRKQLVP